MTARTFDQAVTALEQFAAMTPSERKAFTATPEAARAALDLLDMPGHLRQLKAAKSEIIFARTPKARRKVLPLVAKLARGHRALVMAAPILAAIVKVADQG